MQHLRKRTRLVALVAVGAIGLAACGTDDEATPSDATAQSTDSGTDGGDTGVEQSPTEGTSSDGEGSHAGASGDPFADLYQAAQHVGPGGSSSALAAGIDQAADLEGDVNSPAAQLHVALSSLLQEHVYLAGIAIDAGLSFGLDDANFQAAADTLDRNSVALADLVGQVAPDQRDAFLELWRNHIGFFVTYTEGAASGDQAKKDEAKANLDQYRQQAGQFFEQVTGGALPADAVAEELQMHVSTVFAAIDAAAAGETTVFENLKTAAEHVRVGGSATTLAGGIAQAAGMEGDVESQASMVAATLANLLQEHVYLAGITVKTAYAAGLDSPAFEAAAATLDANSVELADAVGSVAPDQRDAFLELWRNHIGFFVDYAKGAAGGDDQLKQQALDNLDQYRSQAGAFFEQISGGAIPADAVAESLKGHIETLSGAIDSLAAVLVS